MSDTPTGQPSPLEMRLVTYLLRSKRIMDQTRDDVVISREEVRRIFDLTHDAANELARLRAENERLTRERDEARGALDWIARHPHCDYDHPSNGGGQYGTGIADGHRCAANIARRALTPEPEESPR